MVYPVLLVAVVATKLFLAFKAGQKYSANSISEAVKKEMEEMHISKEYADELISKIMSRIKERDIEVGDFIAIMKSVFEELKAKTSSSISSVSGAATTLTAEARASVADMLLEAALLLSPKSKK